MGGLNEEGDAGGAGHFVLPGMEWAALSAGVDQAQTKGVGLVLAMGTGMAQPKPPGYLSLMWVGCL